MIELKDRDVRPTAGLLTYGFAYVVIQRLSRVVNPVYP